MARAVAQFGMLHPAEGPDAFPSHLGFSASKLTAEKAFVPPSITFKDGEVEQHTIAGTRVEVLPSKTDVAESVAYYFPGKKLLVSNALNSGVIFNLYTLRGDWYRDPAIYIAAVDLAMSRDLEFQVDIHGPARIGKDAVIASLEETRDQMQLIRDQTYRAIALGMDAQQAAEYVYMPVKLREGKESYGQLESHVKRVYGARIGWMGWDVYDINPLAEKAFSKRTVAAMGGFDAVLGEVRVANAKRQLRDWQWSLYLTSQLLTLEPRHEEVKTLRAEAARALGQRTSSANARGWYITEALLQEGKLAFAGQTIENYPQLSRLLGQVTPQKLAKSPLDDNVQYLRYLVDPRLAEGLRASFNLHFDDDSQYAIELRNSIIAINSRPNRGPSFTLSKNDGSQLILGQKRFGELDSSLRVVDTAIGR
jgi:alkyl sulfatase BDS1-like metallo-beta-lactamase superfamily hydrolase